MQQEMLPEVTWDPREPETRAEHHPRGVLQDLARLRLIATGEERTASDAAPASSRRTSRA